MHHLYWVFRRRFLPAWPVGLADGQTGPTDRVHLVLLLIKNQRLGHRCRTTKQTMLPRRPASITKLISYLQRCKNRRVFSTGSCPRWRICASLWPPGPKAKVILSAPQVLPHMKLHKAWRARGMKTKQGTLYKCVDPKAITPIARGSGNWEVVFNNLLWRERNTHHIQCTLSKHTVCWPSMQCRESVLSDLRWSSFS